MKRKVAVESELSNVSDYLTRQGYNVLEFQHHQGQTGGFENVDAIITTGLDENFTGMHDIKTDALVIEASGLTPVEIGERLEERL